MRSDDEEFLIQRAAAGDAAALATLLQEYEPRLLQYALRRHPHVVRSLIAPEDIVQETCYEACRLVRGFLPHGSQSFYRWLLHIAHLRIKASIRRYRNRRTYLHSSQNNDEASVLGAIEQLAMYRRTPSASAAAHEFVMTVERSLDRLNKDYQDVIRHRFIEGLSVEETAVRMKRDVDKIYVLCSRALSALRLQIASVSHFR